MASNRYLFRLSEFDLSSTIGFQFVLCGFGDVMFGTRRRVSSFPVRLPISFEIYADSLVRFPFHFVLFLVYGDLF